MPALIDKIKNNDQSARIILATAAVLIAILVIWLGFGAYDKFTTGTQNETTHSSISTSKQIESSDQAKTYFGDSRPDVWNSKLDLSQKEINELANYLHNRVAGSRTRYDEEGITIRSARFIPKDEATTKLDTIIRRENNGAWGTDALYNDFDNPKLAILELTVSGAIYSSGIPSNPFYITVFADNRKPDEDGSWSGHRFYPNE